MPDANMTMGEPMTINVTYTVRVITGAPSTPAIVDALARSVHLCAVGADGLSIVDLTATDAALIAGGD